MISSEGDSKVANNKQPPVGVRSGYPANKKMQ